MKRDVAWVFPAAHFNRHADTGERRRHHLYESVVQRAVKEAVGAAGSASGHESLAAAFVRHAPARGRVRQPGI